MSEIEPDTFNRGAIAKTMCEYIVKTDADIISPLILDGAWGCGKTTHAKRMRECLQRDYCEEVKCIYWNAASSDYASDPLPMFAAALYDHIPQDNRKQYGKEAFTMCFGSFMGGTLSVFRQIIESKTGVNFGKVVTDAEEVASALNIQHHIESQFSNFLEVAGNEKLRVDAARSLIQLVKDGETQDLIIIIDELDRCRPDFALKMIESIKHLFDESGCKFILVMNKKSIYSAIMHLYGLTQEEAVLYLTKYIKMEFQLPRNVIDDLHIKSEPCTIHYFFELMNKESETSWRRGNRLLYSCVSHYIQIKKLQLRDIKKLVDTIRFIQSSIPQEKGLRYTVYLTCLICMLAYILSFKHDLTMRILAKDISSNEVMHAIEEFEYKPGSTLINDEEYFKYIRYVLDYFLARGDEAKMKVKESCNGTFKGKGEVIEEGGEVMEIWLKYATFVR